MNLFLMLLAYSYLMNTDAIYEAFDFSVERFGRPTYIGILLIFQFVFAPVNEVSILRFVLR